MQDERKQPLYPMTIYRATQCFSASKTHASAQAILTTLHESGLLKTSTSCGLAITRFSHKRLLPTANHRPRAILRSTNCVRTLSQCTGWSNPELRDLTAYRLDLAPCPMRSRHTSFLPLRHGAKTKALFSHLQITTSSVKSMQQ